MLKKLISVFVVTTMLLCMLTASVGYGRDLTSSEAEKFLSVLGIVSSDNIDTNVEISREEFSFMLAKVIKYDSLVSDEVRYFKDVESDSYAVNAINALASKGIITVPENREFRPKDTITFEEACKMIVCAMDYDIIADSKGGYPVGYVLEAARMGIKSGVLGKAISYADAYDMLFNAMVAKLPNIDFVDGNGGIFYGDSEGEGTILTEYWNIYRTRGTVEALYGMSLNGSTVSDKNKVVVDDITYKLDSAFNMEPLFGGYAEVFYQKTEDDDMGTIIFASKKSIVDDLEIKPENISDVGINQIKYYNDKNREVTVELSFAKVIYNGRFLESNIKEKLTNINKGTVTLKDSDNDEIYDVVLVNDYRNFVVSNLNDEKIYNRLKTGDILDVDNYESARVFNGDVPVGFDSIVAGNVLSVAQSVDGQFIEVIISANELTGSVTKISNEYGIWYLAIDGTIYPVEKSYGLSLFGSNGQKQSSLLLGKQLKVKLDNFGNIAYIEKATDDMKVGVVLDGKTYKDAFDKEIILKILTEEGVFEVVSLAEKVKVNGERQTDGGKNKVNEILNSADKLIRYTINDDGNINNIVTASFDGSAEYKDEKIRSIYNGIEKQWYNSGRLGTTALTTKETPVFMIPYGDVNPDEEECAVLTYSSLTDNTLYYCNAYHYNTNSVAADAAVVYYEYGDLYDNIDMYRPVIMFSQTEQRLATDGSVEHILIGYTRGGRVEYIIPESISLAEIDEGDMIMLNHGINGNVVEGSKLFANDIEIVCKVNEISTNKKPTWTQNTHHDYLYANSETVINNYYRADFQMSFGYVCKVSGTHVAWSYNTGDNFSEAANITGNIVIYDSSRKDGDKIFIGKADDLVTYGVAGFDCSKIIFRTRGGRLWETFCYN